MEMMSHGLYTKAKEVPYIARLTGLRNEQLWEVLLLLLFNICLLLGRFDRLDDRWPAGPFGFFVALFEAFTCEYLARTCRALSLLVCVSMDLSLLGYGFLP